MNIRKKFSSQIMLLGIFASSILFSLITGLIIQIKDISDYKLEIEALNKEIKYTKSVIEESKVVKDNEDLEKNARDNLDMIKPGEIIYIDIERR